jgi:protein-S-isoprenylcysteine O-methyltransferase Ste14|tara:strand:- start:532 stop:990 length:459 start_codon:yes stop_codon:yes gene_type:complete
MRLDIKTKFPPPLVALTFGFLIKYTKNIFPAIEIKNEIVFGSFMIISGLIIILSAIILFKKYKTTITPLKPSKATQLIVNGVYKFSRNPMYLGLLLVLFGVSTMLNPIGGLFFIPLFILYLNYFQIIPEENAMVDLFKNEFLEYKKNVRRWI